jgi:hypothetical protein
MAMDEFEKILDLNNEFEAERLEEILKDKNIPFGIVPVSDSAFGAIEILENGWGYLEAPSRFKDEILEIYAEISGE